jgi:quinol monooxygenase YgiN
MSRYIRLFQSAVDPADVDEITRLFNEDIRPVFERQPGCRHIDLAVNVTTNAGGLVEGAAFSSWDSLDDLEGALQRREVVEALVRVRQVLRQEPITKTFEVLE